MFDFVIYSAVHTADALAGVQSLGVTERQSRNSQRPRGFSFCLEVAPCISDNNNFPFGFLVPDF